MMDWHRYFTYDATTGEIRWKIRGRSEFKDQRTWTKFNKEYANNVAGYKGPDGYIQVRLNYKLHSAHRIIWEMHNGPIPEGMRIDHESMDTANNRLDNLRLATAIQNSGNSRARKTNKCGVKGICKHQDGGYAAYIGIDGKTKYLGLRATPEEAHELYKAAAIERFGEYARF